MAAQSGNEKRLLLISSSTIYGNEYLDHAEKEIKDLLGSITEVLFVPFALKNWDAYSQRVRARLKALGYSVAWICEASCAEQQLADAEAVFVGGGNTFRLLKILYDYNLVIPIQRRVAEGMPYIGSSAGTNIACPTIKTTNDMPIVQPPSFDALGLVNFQINPHYLDPDPHSTHMGETREERLRQFHEENETPVVGLREPTMIRVENGSILLKGSGSARIFRRGVPPLEVESGAKLNDMLATSR